MARKTNSIGLRLNLTNKNYSNCWYSEGLYSYNLMQSYSIQKYLYETLKTINVPFPQMSYIGGYKKANFLLCYLDPKTRKNSNYKPPGVHKNLFYKYKPKGLNSGGLKKKGFSFGFSHSNLSSKTLWGNPIGLRFSPIEKEKFEKYRPLSKILKGKTLESKFHSSSDKNFWVSSIGGFYSLLKVYSFFDQRVYKNLYNFFPEKTIHQKNLYFYTFCLLEKSFSKRFGKYEARFLGKNINIKSGEIDLFDRNILPMGDSETREFIALSHRSDKPDLWSEPKAEPKAESKAESKARPISLYPLLEQKTFFKQKFQNINYIRYLSYWSESFWGNVVSFSFIKSTNVKGSALFLANYVSYFLERKVLFRQIKQQLWSLSFFNDKKEKDDNCYRTVDFFPQNKYKVAGIKISCSGRVGGRSKKAQRSRKEKFTCGETGLQAFSSRLDFAKTYAETSFGVVGVQVWICYK